MVCGDTHMCSGTGKRRTLGNCDEVSDEGEERPRNWYGDETDLLKSNPERGVEGALCDSDVLDAVSVRKGEDVAALHALSAAA